MATAAVTAISVSGYTSQTSLHRRSVQVAELSAVILTSLTTPLVEKVATVQIHSDFLKKTGDFDAVSYTHLTLPTKRIV